MRWKNESEYKWFMSHDQDDRHVHICHWGSMEVRGRGGHSVFVWPLGMLALGMAFGTSHPVIFRSIPAHPCSERSPSPSNTIKVLLFTLLPDRDLIYININEPLL